MNKDASPPFSLDFLAFFLVFFCMVSFGFLSSIIAVKCAMTVLYGLIMTMSCYKGEAGYDADKPHKGILKSSVWVWVKLSLFDLTTHLYVHSGAC